MIKNALSFGKALKQVSFFTKPQRFSSLNSFTTLHFPTVSYAFAEDTKSAIRKEEKANFKNMSEELKKYREYRMFGPETQKVKTYLSETEKQKQLKELTTLVDKFVGSYFFTPRFDKEMFFKVLSAVSYFYDSDLIVRDEKFRKVMLDIGEKQLKQFDGRLATAFISFCALNRIDDVVIWEYFNSYVNNNLNSLQLEDKVTILKAVNPSNKDNMIEFYDKFENAILENIQEDKTSKRYYKIHSVLEAYRKAGQGSENFYFTLEETVLEGIQDIPMEPLIQIILHYSENPNVNPAIREEIFQKAEERLCISHIFLNTQQMLGALYSFIRVRKGSDAFFRLMQDRVLLNVDSFSLDEINKLMIIFSNLPHYAPPVFSAVEKHITKNIKKIHRESVSRLFQLFSEFRCGSLDFFNRLIDYLVGQVYNMSAQEFTKNLWACAQLEVSGADVYLKKAHELVEAKKDLFSIKELASMAWSFAVAGYDEKPLFLTIEREIQKHMLREDEVTGRDLAFVLWAYVQRIPMTKHTLDRIKELILVKKDTLNEWDVATILWGFSKFKGYPVKDFFKELIEPSKKLVEKMDGYELAISMRAFAEEDVGDEELFLKFKERIEAIIDQLDLVQTVSIIYSMDLLTVIDSPKVFGDLREKLREQAIRLQSQVATKPEKEDESLFDFGSVDAYEQNLKYEEYKKIGRKTPKKDEESH